MYPLATNGRFSRNSFQYISYPDMDLHPDSFPTDVEFAKLVITFASLSVFSIPHKIISLFRHARVSSTYPCQSVRPSFRHTFFNFHSISVSGRST